MEDFHGLISDTDFPGRSLPEPFPSNDESHPRPLRLLQSLFTDRLSFLQKALDELEGARKDREQLAQYALKELDPEIQECEVSLSALKAAMNNTERRGDLERRLFALKRQRKSEALISWRDLGVPLPIAGGRPAAAFSHPWTFRCGKDKRWLSDRTEPAQSRKAVHRPRLERDIQALSEPIRRQGYSSFHPGRRKIATLQSP